MCAWWVGLGKETPTSNTHAYQLLKTMYNTAVEDKAATENPCQIKSAGKPPKPRDVKSLTPAELEKVAEKVPERYRVAVPVAAWCGLRFGELIELRRKDIHNEGDRMTLRIRRAATIVDNGLVVGGPKTDAGIRDVTVPPHVAEILRAHMQKHTGRGPEAFVFTTTRGRRLSTTAFTKSVKKGFAAVGKPDMPASGGVRTQTVPPGTVPWCVGVPRWKVTTWARRPSIPCDCPSRRRAAPR